MIRPSGSQLSDAAVDRATRYPSGHRRRRDTAITKRPGFVRHKQTSAPLVKERGRRLITPSDVVKVEHTAQIPNRSRVEPGEIRILSLRFAGPPDSIVSRQTLSHVTLSDEAHAAREDITTLATALAAMPDTSLQLQSVFGKWPGTFARLCLVYHLIEVAGAPLRGFVPPIQRVVSGYTANHVRDYMRTVLAPMQIRADHLMFSTRMDRHAAWIADYILARGLNRIVVSQILASYRPLRAPDHRGTLDSVMDSLERVGWLAAEVPARQTTRAPTAWRVNPLVHIRYAERAEAERKRRAEVRETIAEYVDATRNADVS